MRGRFQNGQGDAARGQGTPSLKDRLQGAMAMLRQDNVDEAEHTLEDILEEQPEIPQVYLGLARCAVKRNDFERALDCVQTALSLKQDLPNAYSLRGEIYLAFNEVEPAFDDFQKAIELKPSLVKPHIKLAQMYLEDGQPELAREHAEIALEYEPHRDSLRLMLCNIYEEAGDLIAAQEEAYHAAQANPDSVAAHIKQGAISLKQRDYLRAERSFEKLLKLKPDSAMGSYFLAMAALGQQKYQLAESTLLQARELAQESPEQSMPDLAQKIEQKLVTAYSKQGKHEEALVAVKAMVKRTRDTRALKQLADVYFELGQYELANQQYRAIALGKDRLTSRSAELRELLQAQDEDPQELAEAWRAAYAGLRQAGAEQEEEDEVTEAQVAQLVSSNS